MKKFISFMLCIVFMVCAFFAFSVTAYATYADPDSEIEISPDGLHTIIVDNNFFSRYSQSVYLMGDANMDNEVAITDATKLQRYLADLDYIIEPAEYSCDVDFNRQVNVLDATYIQQYLALLETPLAYCGDYVAIIDYTPVMPVVPSIPNGNGNYLYFENTESWDEVYAYFWSSDGTNFTDWPGEPMELVDFEYYFRQIYKVEAPIGADMVIFSDGEGSYTEDIYIESMNKIYYDNRWYDWYEYYY